MAPDLLLHSNSCCRLSGRELVPHTNGTVHRHCMQAGAGLVADSVPESEYEETLNKAAALGRAIDLAEQAFVQEQC